MKRTAIIFIFIFLTGLFAGLFFSSGLSDENNSYLAAQLLAGFSSSYGFFKTFVSALLSSFGFALIMLIAVLTKFLAPLPPLMLAYKSFSIGFCSGLLFLNAKENAFAISAVKLLPPNLFFIPAFIILSAAVFTYSISGSTFSFKSRSAGNKKSRRSRKGSNLLHILILSAALIIAGSLTQAVCHSIAL